METDISLRRTRSIIWEQKKAPMRRQYSEMISVKQPYQGPTNNINPRALFALTLLDFTPDDAKQVSQMMKSYQLKKFNPDLFTVECISSLLINVDFNDPSLVYNTLCCVPAIIKPKILLVYFMNSFYGMFEPVTHEKKERIFYILQMWITLFPSHFTAVMIDVLSMFFTAKDVEPYVKHLIDILPTINPKIHLDPEYTHPKKFESITKTHTLEEIAKQIALIDNDFFSDFTTKDIIRAIYNQKDPKSLKALTKHFEIISGFVSLSIVFYSTPKERAVALCNWIRIARYLLNIQDFLGLFSIMTGLSVKSVSRLSVTFKQAFKKDKEAKKYFDELVVLTDMANDYVKYRELIEMKKPPIVPFIACYQRDWVYFNELNPKRKDGLISRKHLDGAVEHMAKIERYRGHYRFLVNKEIEYILKGIKESPDFMKLMQISLIREPPHN